MHPIYAPRLQQQNNRRAMRILFAGEPSQANDQMRLVHDAGQQMMRLFGFGLVGFEVLPRLDHHLFGRHGTTAVPTHAIGEHSHHQARARWVRKKADAVLLLFAITQMSCYTGFDSQWHEIRSTGQHS